jgi:hypothetical protein
MNKNLSFPYPVLGNSTDFSFNEFNLNIRERMIAGHHEFKGMFDFGSMHDDFDKLLSDNSISFTVLVKSSSTLLREYFTSKEKTILFQLPVGSLKGNIEFTGYIVIDKNIKNFTPDHQNEEFFFESSYDLHAGEILGVSNTLKWLYYPDFKGRTNSNKKPIISVVPDDNSKKDRYRVLAWGENQIGVGVPRKWFKIIETLKKSEFEFFHKSMFYLPVLTEAISKVRDNDAYEELEGLKWYEIIKQDLEKRDLIDSDYDSVELAQILFNDPMRSYIKSLVYIDEERQLED